MKGRSKREEVWVVAAVLGSVVLWGLFPWGASEELGPSTPVVTPPEVRTEAAWRPPAPETGEGISSDEAVSGPELAGRTEAGNEADRRPESDVEDEWTMEPGKWQQQPGIYQSGISNEELKKKADAGDAAAQFVMAGRMRDAAPLESARYAALAAEQGYFRAQHFMGTLLQNPQVAAAMPGMSSQQYYAMAAATCRAYAALGDHEAMRILGMMAEEGQGRAADVGEALSWYTMAKNYGSSGAVWRYDRLTARTATP